MRQPVDQPHDRIAVDHLADVIIVGGDRLQQHRQVRCLPLAGHMALGKADVAAGQDPAGKPVVTHIQNGGRAGAGPVELMNLAIGQLHRQPAIGPVGRQQPQQQAEPPRGPGRHGRDLGRHGGHARPPVTVNSVKGVDPGLADGAQGRQGPQTRLGMVDDRPGIVVTQPDPGMTQDFRRRGPRCVKPAVG